MIHGVAVDAACGPELLPCYPAGCASMLAYEADVYHFPDADRITIMPDKFGVGGGHQIPDGTAGLSPDHPAARGRLCRAKT